MELFRSAGVRLPRCMLGNADLQERLLCWDLMWEEKNRISG